MGSHPQLQVDCQLILGKLYTKNYRGVYDMILDSNRLIASVYDTIQVWDLSTYQMINLLNPKSLDSPNAATTCFAVLRDKLVKYNYVWFFIGKVAKKYHAKSVVFCHLKIFFFASVISAGHWDQYITFCNGIGG